ncbi:MAG: ATP-grasp domain-containing protein [Myxococcales bacterium]
MRFVILSRSRSIYTTRRLTDAARARGHVVRVLDPTACELLMAGRATEVFHRGKKVGPVDVLVPRVAQSITSYGLAVVDHFALRGVALVNDAPSIAQARNKLRCLQSLAAHGIEVPATVMARDAGQIEEMIHLVGGVPVLVKLLQPNGRAGVMVCESLQSMGAALETVLGLGHNFIVQQYVRGPGGRDLRALVVGDRVEAAVRRRPPAGKLARTLGRGARFQPVSLSRQQERMAIESARVIGLSVCAVDMIEHGGRTRIFEVNASPGLEHLEAATGRDLAVPVIELAERLVMAHNAGQGRHAAR